MDKTQSTLLVTGDAGFIGSNFVKYFTKKHPNRNLLNLDKLTYASSIDYIASIPTENYRFIQGDIADTELLQDLFETYNITGVINFAAESHVDRSIQNAQQFITTNIQGTFNLIHCAKTAWEK